MFYSFVRGLCLQDAEVLYSMQNPVRFCASARVCFPDGHPLDIARSRNLCLIPIFPNSKPVLGGEQKDDGRSTARFVGGRRGKSLGRLDRRSFSGASQSSRRVLRLEWQSL